MGRSVVDLSDDEIALVRESSLLVGKTLAEVARHIGPGAVTGDLDRLAEEFIRDHGAIPGFKGLYGCPSTLLISVNEEVVHGLPAGIWRGRGQALQLCWDGMPEPKLVIAVGACAISGGLFADSPALDRSFVERFTPSLYVPGCPPHPLTFISGILDLLGIAS